jgi:hypothetical protein
MQAATLEDLLLDGSDKHKRGPSRLSAGRMVTVGGYAAMSKPETPTPLPMVMTQFHLGIFPNGPAFVSADIEVPGLGKVSIKDCVSQATIDAIKQEVIFACKQKMGQKP